MNPSLDVLFRPRSVAVVGTSRRPGTIGYQILDNLIRHGYAGVVYPVNPAAEAVHSVRAYPSVSAIPGPVELAVLVIPKEHVVGVARECGEKGVRGLVVISAGFKEVGPEGAAREAELMEVVREHGMRLVGPNCMGLLNTDAEVSLNATFAPTMPPPGPLSFMSQSGALGVTILDYAAELGIGIRHFVSVGNKPDVSGNDLIEYWEDDPGTRVILMYLENFGNPRRFTRIARRVTRKKPIVVVKSGRTGAGARAASSHTGALAGADLATDALLAQCGVLRADSVEELFDIAMALEDQPVPRGGRVAIVTNAGGPGIIIADALEAAGLEVVELTDETQARLRDLLPSEAAVRNPVDMIASATSETYREALGIVLADDRVDATVAAFVPPLGIRQVDVAQSIVAARRAGPDKPLLAVLMGREGLPEGKAELHDAGVPAYTFPESAARALAALHRYRRWLDRPVREPEDVDIDDARVASVLDDAAARGREHLLEPEALEVLAACGIPVVEHVLCRTADEAVEAAATLGGRVVLKVVSPGIIHKSDVGGVRVGVQGEADVRAAWDEIVDRVGTAEPEAVVEGILVTRFLDGGRETILGMHLDPGFGPVLMFGLGGIYVEALRDVTFRIQPVSAQDAREMIRAIRGHRLLAGVRGEGPVDEDALVDAVQRLSRLVGRHHRIAELDINPFLAFPEGGVAVDARIRITRKDA
ncbi:MAG TPA: acetate--CoA ligase family protein [Longimicrobiales bacterium]|nr:acetate--CoA ligase family protein [Longimicrobiales bacterium]